MSGCVIDHIVRKRLYSTLNEERIQYSKHLDEKSWGDGLFFHFKDNIKYHFVLILFGLQRATIICIESLLLCLKVGGNIFLYMCVILLYIYIHSYMK